MESRQIAVFEKPRPAVICRDKIIVAAGLTSAFIGVAGLGLVGDALLYFYISFVLAALGVVVVLSTVVRSAEVDVQGTPRSLQIAIIVSLGLLVRAFLMFRGPLLSFDLHWYADYVTFLRMHEVPYTAAFYFPYPQGFLDFLSAFVHAPNPLAAIHSSFIVVDCLVAVGLFLVLEQTTTATFAFWGAVGYDLLPMPALEVGRIGHFETLVSLFLVVFVYALWTRRSFAAALAIVAATSIKAFPLVAAPAVIYTWVRRRDVAYSVVGASVALALILSPFVHEIPNVIAYWTGASASSPTAGSSFVANSLPAIVRDLPFAWPVIPAAQTASAVTLLLLVAYAVWMRRRKETATSAERLSLWGRFPLATFFGVFLIYGLYLFAKPWMPSQFAYSWWSPTPLVIGSAIALAGLSAIGLYCVWKEDAVLVPVQNLGLLVAALITFVVMLRGNVNPWYLMPVVPLLMCALPSRSSVLALGCLMTFYASFNSTSFAALGWNDVISRPTGWHASYGLMPSRVPTGKITTLASDTYRIQFLGKTHNKFLLFSYGLCAPRLIAFDLSDGNKTMAHTEPVLNGAASLLIPAETMTRGLLHIKNRGTCKPKVQVVRALVPDANVATSPRGITVSMLENPMPGGWGQSVTVSSRVFAWAFPNTALAFDIVGDVDPTFHHWPFAVSVFVQGKKIDGLPSGQVPVLQREVSATNIGPIRYRIPVFNLPAHLNTIESVTFTVDSVDDRGEKHSIQINNVRLVNESRWDVWTAKVTGLVSVSLLVALAVIVCCLALVDPRSPETGRKDLNQG